LYEVGAQVCVRMVCMSGIGILVYSMYVYPRFFP